jgi:electron transfer flavoprotein alpha subunit
MSSNTILVLSEKPSLLAELLGKARQEADSLGWTVSALVLGSNNTNLDTLDADVVYRCEADARNPEVVVSALAEAVRQSKALVTLVGATNCGMEVSARVAERTDCAYAAWTANFEIDPASNAVTAQCMLYTGMAVATYQFKPGPVIFTVAQGVFTANPVVGKKASETILEFKTAAARTTILEYRPKQASGARLENARMVVDVGQGFKQREDLQMAQTLAELLNGQLACSRPVASDRDWFPEWLGLSGLKIKPELCLVVGVSGAIQHIIGIRDSHVIASVNTDENAAIFARSDYCVVADLYEFLPALIDRIKARGIRLA